MKLVLPDGPAALGHPTNEDLFVGTPVLSDVRTPFIFVFSAGDVAVLRLIGI
jgi:hypothetical protein